MERILASRMLARCSICVLATFVLSTGTVSAQDPAGTDIEPTEQVDAAAMAGHVGGYYRGERISAFIVTSLGVAGIATGIPLVLQDGDLERGAGWTALINGGLQLIIAIAYAIDVTGRLKHFEDALAADPAAFQLEETEHMAGTISRFIIYSTAEIVLTLTGVGLAIAGFAANEDVLEGVGIAMAAAWFPIVIIDLINQFRGRAYADRVRRMDVTTSARLPEPTRSNIDRFLDSAAVTDGFYLSLSRPF